jgi:hypothetical protein
LNVRDSDSYIAPVRMLRSAQPIIRLSRLAAGEVAPLARVRGSFYGAALAARRIAAR